ncbi:MAG: HAD-IIB family hydrolase [Hyphomicrobiaceae bacterium]|nr:HAD-IIB family hydrolase [Hyphomicrobiaceae bacterium]
MRFIAMALDFDGTLALNGCVAAPTVEALRQTRDSGRKLILVTGRDLGELLQVFPGIDVFDMVLAENGALLYEPNSRQETLLADPPTPELVAFLRAKGVAPLAVGRSIVATWQPNELAVLAAIRDLGLDLQIIFNKGAVMVLPSGVDKASGLAQALDRLGLSPLNVVGVGDAENDLAFLRTCGAAVAVANALPSVHEACDLSVPDHGAGVVDVCTRLIAADLDDVATRLDRVQPVLGSEGSAQVRIGGRETVLVAGLSGAGKSTTVTAVLEQMVDAQLQFCVIDPEGDYEGLPNTIVIGDAKQEPRLAEVLELLAKPGINVVVNLLAIDPRERPPVAAKILSALAGLRTTKGRPHWIVVDEAHHCLPREWDAAPLALPRSFPGVLAVTVHPEAMSADFLGLVTTMVAAGKGGEAPLAEFCACVGAAPPPADVRLDEGELALLRRDGALTRLKAMAPRGKKRRHFRKYAIGELDRERSFHFRGPDDALNLRAQNLESFLNIGSGVDAATWLFHLGRGDYSDWVREQIKDQDLADEIAEIERSSADDAPGSRARIKEAIQRRYTAPAKGRSLGPAEPSP